MNEELSQVMQDRLKKVEELKAAGINPYGYSFEVTHPIPVCVEQFKEFEAAATVISTAGRLWGKKVMGKATFAFIRSEGCGIQIYVKRDDVGEENYAGFKKFDIGDFVGVTGKMFTTRTGEPTLVAEKIELLSKNVRPFPIVKEKDGQQFDAFTDVESRYRQRYVDLFINKEVRDVFVKRHEIIHQMRNYLTENHCIEVETPVLQPLYGGGLARPFVTHNNALDVDLYLRIADELYLKRLIIGGLDRVFEISKDFRNEGIDKQHNPEFTQMEVYVAYKDYNWMMNFTEQMIESIALKVNGSLEVEFQGKQINLQAPWQRITMRNAIIEYAGIDFYGKNEAELQAEAAKSGIDTEGIVGIGKLVDEIYKSKVRPNLIQPAFIIDHPIELSPLAKNHRSDEKLVERFQPVIAGMEVGNAFSELNDPFEQRKRFEAQQDLRNRGEDESQPMDEDFLRAMEYGMPPTAGLGIGIDRLTMLLTNQSSIRDVVLFPMFKPE